MEKIKDAWDKVPYKSHVVVAVVAFLLGALIA